MNTNPSPWKGKSFINEQDMNMISYTTCLYLDTSRSFNKFTDIIMKSLQIIFTDFWARGFDVENQMDVNFW